MSCEGFTKQTLNLATDRRWCTILHKNSDLKTVTFLQGRNHTLHKDVLVTRSRHGTPGRSPWCNPFKEKRVRNKDACEFTYAECNGRWCTTSALVEPHIRQFCVFTAPSSVKCASCVHRIYSGHKSSTSIRARNWRANTRRCCGPWGFSYSTMCSYRGISVKWRAQFF